jgi:hypothetical protein
MLNRIIIVRVQAENDELSDALAATERTLERRERRRESGLRKADEQEDPAAHHNHIQDDTHSSRCVDETTLVDVLSRVLHEHIDGRLEATQTRQVAAFADAVREILHSVLSPQLQTLQANIASNTAQEVSGSWVHDLSNILNLTPNHSCCFTQATTLT